MCAHTLKCLQPLFIPHEYAECQQAAAEECALIPCENAGLLALRSAISMLLPPLEVPVQFAADQKCSCTLQAPAKPESVLREALLLAIPTAFDLAATVLMNVGLLSVTASVYQMVRIHSGRTAKILSLPFHAKTAGSVLRKKGANARALLRSNMQEA